MTGQSCISQDSMDIFISALIGICFEGLKATPPTSFARLYEEVAGSRSPEQIFEHAIRELYRPLDSLPPPEQNHEFAPLVAMQGGTRQRALQVAYLWRRMIQIAWMKNSLLRGVKPTKEQAQELLDGFLRQHLTAERGAKFGALLRLVDSVKANRWDFDHEAGVWKHRSRTSATYFPETLGQPQHLEMEPYPPISHWVEPWSWRHEWDDSRTPHQEVLDNQRRASARARTEGKWRGPRTELAVADIDPNGEGKHCIERFMRIYAGMTGTQPALENLMDVFLRILALYCPAVKTNVSPALMQRFQEMGQITAIGLFREAFRSITPEIKALPEPESKQGPTTSPSFYYPVPYSPELAKLAEEVTNLAQTLRQILWLGHFMAGESLSQDKRDREQHSVWTKEVMKDASTGEIGRRVIALVGVSAEITGYRFDGATGAWYQRGPDGRPQQRQLASKYLRPRSGQQQQAPVRSSEEVPQQGNVDGGPQSQAEGDNAEAKLEEEQQLQDVQPAPQAVPQARPCTAAFFALLKGLFPSFQGGSHALLPLSETGTLAEDAGQLTPQQQFWIALLYHVCPREVPKEMPAYFVSQRGQAYANIIASRTNDIIQRVMQVIKEASDSSRRKIAMEEFFEWYKFLFTASWIEWSMIDKIPPTMDENKQHTLMKLRSWMPNDLFVTLNNELAHYLQRWRFTTPRGWMTSIDANTGFRNAQGAITEPLQDTGNSQQIIMSSLDLNPQQFTSANQPWVTLRPWSELASVRRPAVVLVQNSPVALEEQIKEEPKNDDE